MKALLKNYRQSPRKVRLVAKSIKGKKVSDALSILTFMPKRAAMPLKKLINSALANAKDKGVQEDNLVVENIEVNKGFTLKRFRPRARGSASPINKRTSHVLITLKDKNAKKEEVTSKVEKVVEEKKSPKKEVAEKKTPAKKTAKKAVKKTSKK